MPRTLLLPVETLSRELDGKLLMALEAAGRGWEVVIGKRAALHDRLPSFPPAVYFSKGFRSGNRAMFRIIRGLGHAIAGLDEEALVQPSDEVWRMKMDREVLGALSIAFAWGEHDAALYAGAEGLEGTPIVLSGNPRMDMLRPELDPYFAPEVERLRGRYGHFALFNTNFAMVNNFVTGQTRFRVAEKVPEAEAAEMKGRLVAHKAHLFDAFLRLLPDLADALAPDALVVRPHPSEDARAWAEAARGHANVHVVHEGSVVPWLAAAEVLMHNGCTSAVEAAVLGTPALAYRPVRAPGCDNELPNGLSHAFEAPDALIAEIVERVRDGRGGRGGRHALNPERRVLLEHHVSALDGPFAFTRLLDGLEGALDDAPPSSAARRLGSRARHAARTISRAVRKRSPRAKGNPAYLSHKFPAHSARDVQARIARLAAALGRPADVDTGEIAPNLFRIARRVH